MPSNKGSKILKSTPSQKKNFASTKILSSGSRPNQIPPYVGKNLNLEIISNSPRKQNF